MANLYTLEITWNFKQMAFHKKNNKKFKREQIKSRQMTEFPRKTMEMMRDGRREGQETFADDKHTNSTEQKSGAVSYYLLIV